MKTNRLKDGQSKFRVKTDTKERTQGAIFGSNESEQELIKMFHNLLSYSYSDTILGKLRSKNGQEHE